MMAAMSVTLGAPGAHRGEGFVTGRVEERDHLAVVLDLIRADVLRDAAGLSGRDFGLANRVEQTRLAVIDVAHHRDHRRPRLEIGRVVDDLLLDRGLLVGGVHDLDRPLEVIGQDGHCLVGQRLGDRRHLAVAHHRLDDLAGGDAEQLRDVLDAGARRDLDELPFGGDDRCLLATVGLMAAVAAAAAVVLRPAAATRCLCIDDDAPPAAALAAGAPAALSGRQVGLLDDLLIDGLLTLRELDARAPQVHQDVVDGRTTLLGDVGNQFLAGHSPHRLSLRAGTGEAPAQIVVDRDTAAERAIERAAPQRGLETRLLRAEPSAPAGAAGDDRVGDLDALAAHREVHERVARRAATAPDAGAQRSRRCGCGHHSDATCWLASASVSVSASFWCPGMPQ